MASAMGLSQLNALTTLVSGYRDVESAMAAILLEADEVVVKPFDMGCLTELVRESGESGRDTATVLQQYRRKLVGADEAEQ
ncbi:MAG: hypothetical protein WBE44_08385 [Terriglobales bacterium]